MSLIVSSQEQTRAQLAASLLKTAVELGITGAEIIPPSLPEGSGEVFTDAASRETRRMFYALAQALSEPEPWQAVTTFQAFWENYDPTTFYAAGFYKDRARVYLRGLVRDPTRTAGFFDPIFILPEGYRPKRQVAFNQVGGDDYPLRVEINSIGHVYVVSDRFGSGVWQDYIFLDGIHFDTRD